MPYLYGFRVSQTPNIIKIERIGKKSAGIIKEKDMERSRK